MTGDASAACQVCSLVAFKYCCPRCEIKFCSVACCARHKANAACDGKRDRTKFVPLASFDDETLLSGAFVARVVTHAQTRQRTMLTRDAASASLRRRRLRRRFVAGLGRDDRLSLSERSGRRGGACRARGERNQAPENDAPLARAAARAERGGQAQHRPEIHGDRSVDTLARCASTVCAHGRT